MYVYVCCTLNMLYVCRTIRELINYVVKHVTVTYINVEIVVTMKILSCIVSWYVFVIKINELFVGIGAYMARDRESTIWKTVSLWSKR